MKIVDDAKLLESVTRKVAAIMGDSSASAQAIKGVPSDSVWELWRGNATLGGTSK